MSDVYNPYHFIPVSAQTEGQKQQGIKREAAGHGFVTHERYVAKTHSGVIVCRVTTRTPIVIGAEQRRSPGDYADVAPYLGCDGRPAIPASSLRGMVSSLAEAASNSALRILEDLPYAYRPPYQRGAGLQPRVPKGGTHAYFRGVDTELLPMSPQRRAVSIAERIFGFVEEEHDEGGKGEEWPRNEPKALASRVRFSDALLTDGVASEDAVEAGPMPLRILSSPKNPPCPALYFRTAARPGWIVKQDLTPVKHVPQGRKVYLHHDAPEGNPWRTSAIHENENRDQKNRVRPIKRGQCFWFHIGFENLTHLELGLLLYALEPVSGFQHKIGMGKPLGLGSVQLQIMGIFEIDRLTRYTVAGLRRPRYETASLAAGASEADWPVRYAHFKKSGVEVPNLLQLRAVVSQQLVVPATHKAICAYGLTAPPCELIHTPTLVGQDPESETFRWFVANEKPPNRQFLRPLEEGLKPLKEI